MGSGSDSSESGFAPADSYTEVVPNARIRIPLLRRDFRRDLGRIGGSGSGRLRYGRRASISNWWRLSAGASFEPGAVLS
jgi:hypothetical protein